MKTVFISVDIAASWSGEVQMSDEAWERMKATDSRTIDDYLSSPVIDYIKWNEIDVRDIEVMDLGAVGEDGKITDRYEG